MHSVSRRCQRHCYLRPHHVHTENTEHNALALSLVFSCSHQPVLYKHQPVQTSACVWHEGRKEGLVSGVSQRSFLPRTLCVVIAYVVPVRPPVRPCVRIHCVRAGGVGTRLFWHAAVRPEGKHWCWCVAAVSRENERSLSPH